MTIDNSLFAADFTEVADPNAVTSLEGSSFCISAPSGDVVPGRGHGLFVRDTRFLSTWRLLIDGSTPEPLSAIPLDSYAMTFVSRVQEQRRNEPATQLLIVRNRYVGDGMREDIEVRNLTRTAFAGELRLQVGVDFAHVFDVKAGHVRPRGFHSVEVISRQMIYTFADQGRSRRLELVLPKDAKAGPGLAEIPLDIAGLDRFVGNFEFHVTVDETVMEPRHHRRSRSKRSSPQQAKWNVPKISVDNEALASTFNRATEDLGALRIFDPDQPGEVVIAAGAPWYMALFGRDSLITSMMTLPVDPQIAIDTLRALVRHQGTRVDVDKDEEPGKILHEMRFRFDGPTAGSSRSAYYGSIDSTPLFLMLLGEAYRWGVPREVIEELLPVADKAIDWIDKYGDRDGDGFVEYKALGERGFPNQGWKDSPDGINFANGKLPEAPIALCEVQGYVYRAYRLRAEIAEAFGDEARAQDLRARATKLKKAFNAQFYLPRRGDYAVGLDAAKKPIDSLASNMGHALWTGIVDADKARSVVEHLMSEEMFTGFGIRTLASSMGAYNPTSYHNGSVWPHDNAIALAGMMRYGYVDAAHRLALGLVAAADGFRGRLPEVFCGLDRAEFPEPVPYPSACSPQAWAAGSTLLMIRVLLRLDPVVPKRTLYLQPSVPRSFFNLKLDNVALGEGRISIDTTSSSARVSGLPDDMQVIAGELDEDVRQG